MGVIFIPGKPSIVVPVVQLLSPGETTEGSIAVIVVCSIWIIISLICLFLLLKER